jgi:hypothetical protein
MNWKLQVYRVAFNPEKFCLVVALQQALKLLNSRISGEFEGSQHLVKTFDELISIS